jgi:hypothetical protein
MHKVLAPIIKALWAENRLNNGLTSSGH